MSTGYSSVSRASPIRLYPMLLSHRSIVELGTAHGIRPGDFFGPVSAAHCLKEALQAAVTTNQIPDTLRVYISQDAISE